jgi:hypothetical protein
LCALIALKNVHRALIKQLHEPQGVISSAGEFKLGLMLSHMTQKPVLRVEYGARALRNPVGRGTGRRMVHISEHASAWWGVCSFMNS